MIGKMPEKLFLLKQNDTTVKTEITAGITIGIILYIVINLACKKWRDISPIMYVLAVLFVLKYIFL